MSAKMIQAARPINIQEQGSFEMIEDGNPKVVYISNDYKQNYNFGWKVWNQPFKIL